MNNDLVKAYQRLSDASESLDEWAGYQWQVYRGWVISTFDGKRFTVARKGHQSYHNFKSLENAKAKVDAIVG